MGKIRAWSAGFFAFIVATLIITSDLPEPALSGDTRGEETILVVAQLDKMKTRNPLPAIADFDWTHDVLSRVYDSVGKIHPDTDQIIPHILKGIDSDDDGAFESSEYGVFAKTGGAGALNITAYYDFNGVYFHDSVQATIGDLLFSYHLVALNPRMNSHVKVLMDMGGRTGTNFTTDRWLFVSPATKDWEDEPPVGNGSLRFAIRFRLQEPFVLFYRHTLAGMTLFPRHVWEGTGWRMNEDTGSVVSPLHPDFGRAVYPESDPRFGQGVPVNETTYEPFQYLNSSTPVMDSAEEWLLSDDDVIGTGPFKFESFDEQQAVALVKRNPLFFAGKDEKTGVTIDPSLAPYIHAPFIDGIMFTVYSSHTLCLLAMRNSFRPSVDFCHSDIPPEYLPDILPMRDIRIWSRPDPGFTYLGYNLMRHSVGIWHYGQPDQFDVGYHFRKAVAHLIDKETIVKNFLQGYGVPGIVPVSPNNVRFYNASIHRYSFDIAAAQAELALAHQDAVWLSTHGEPQAATWYSKDANGTVIMPGIGTSPFNLRCPYLLDYVKSNSCMLIVHEMAKFGIRVSLNNMPYQQGLEDFYVSGWTIDDEDPGYLYDLFHSSNAASGHNYVGFNDALSDEILDNSMREMNESRRIELLKWEQGIIADKLPYDTLYFRTKMEATRQDRFVGWRPLHGTIWNFWSLLNLRPPMNTQLHVTIESESAVAAGESMSLTVRVKDQEGESVDVANVRLTVTPPWAGNFSSGGGQPRNDLSATTSLGKLTVTYLAPDVSHVQNVTITVTATHPEFIEIPENSLSFIVTVYPVGEKFLSVKATTPDSDLVIVSGRARFEIVVTDAGGFQADDAFVIARTEPPLEPPYGLNKTEGMALEMRELSFIAPPGRAVSLNETPFSLIIDASRPGDHNGSSFATFIVVRMLRTCPGGERIVIDEECPEGQAIATGLVIATVGAMLIAVIVSAIAESYEKRRRKSL